MQLYFKYTNDSEHQVQQIIPSLHGYYMYMDMSIKVHKWKLSQQVVSVNFTTRYPYTFSVGSALTPDPKANVVQQTFRRDLAESEAENHRIEDHQLSQQRPVQMLK
jgi:hypothetical protein